MKYGARPTSLGKYTVVGEEFLLYQYLPIKMSERRFFTMERRLYQFRDIVLACLEDFEEKFGFDTLLDHYVYLTAKRQYQTAEVSMNRHGYHSDGFGSNDINYIWSDKQPTVFNCGKFDISDDDQLSMKQMEDQALPGNDFVYPEGTLLRLTPANIHKVGATIVGVRTFLKISFSIDKYNLAGNSHNYHLDYDWEMKSRGVGRNIPCHP
jgi:hypothetical protein